MQTPCTSIALQFPDSMLEYAPEVTMELDQMLREADSNTSRLVYALADT